MNRRWSCRLGIRLGSQQLIPNDGCDEGGKSITVIREICKDTLAEKDGRLRVFDRVLMVIFEIAKGLMNVLIYCFYLSFYLRNRLMMKLSIPLVRKK